MSEGVLHTNRDLYIDLVKSLKDTGYDMCVDVTSIDFLKQPERELPYGMTPERFEVVTNLLSLTNKVRARIRVQIPANDPVCPSIVEMYPGAEAMEREVFDLMGIRFSDHPDLTRILMPEDWEGHPLRKDYGEIRIPVQFKYPAGKS